MQLRLQLAQEKERSAEVELRLEREMNEILMKRAKATEDKQDTDIVETAVRAAGDWVVNSIRSCTLM